MIIFLLMAFNCISSIGSASMWYSYASESMPSTYRQHFKLFYYALSTPISTVKPKPIKSQHQKKLKIQTTHDLRCLWWSCAATTWWAVFGDHPRAGSRNRLWRWSHKRPCQAKCTSLSTSHPLGPLQLSLLGLHFHTHNKRSYPTNFHL